MVQGVTTFEKLVANLTREEREILLERLRESAPGEEEPLYIPDQEEEVKLDLLYVRLGLFRKFWLFVRSVFTGRNPIELLESSFLSKLCRNVDRQHPGLCDYRKLELHTPFCDELENLRKGLQPISPIVRTAKDNRRDFFAFLIGAEFPEQQERLIDATNPEYLVGEIEPDRPFDLKKRMSSDVQSIMVEMGDQVRRVIYPHARFFDALCKLTYFPFARMLSPVVDEDVRVISIHSARDDLVELGDILASLARASGPILYRALATYHLRETSPDVPVERSDQGEIEEMEKIEVALDAIRGFNQGVPMATILKLATDDFAYKPESRGGGEDWFAHYRNFWDERIDHVVEKYVFEASRDKIIDQALRLVKLPKIAMLPNYASGVAGEDCFVAFENSAALSLALLEHVFSGEVQKYLSVILVEGDFYKAQNRDALTDAIAVIKEGASRVNSVDTSLGPLGEIGKEIARIREESEDTALQSRKTATFLAQADRKMEKALNDIQLHVFLLVEVVKGILYGDSSSRYDTLSNLHQVGGRDNRGLLEALERRIDAMEKAHKLLAEMFELERGTH